MLIFSKLVAQFLEFYCYLLYIVILFIPSLYGHVFECAEILGNFYCYYWSEQIKNYLIFCKKMKEW
jgi:hypothetical protein